MTGNERRYVTGLERRADSAGTLYVISLMWMTAGAAFFVAGVLIGLAGWGWRAW